MKTSSLLGLLFGAEAASLFCFSLEDVVFFDVMFNAADSEPPEALAAVSAAEWRRR